MVLIFSASSDSGSVQHSSRLIGPLLHWLLPNLSPEHVNLVILVVRKCAHLTEYAVLALLFWRARGQTLVHDRWSWDWSLAGEAMWVTMFYAASDEFHQTFVPSREGCVRDVMIDTSGALAGLFALWLFGRLRKR